MYATCVGDTAKTVSSERVTGAGFSAFAAGARRKAAHNKMTAVQRMEVTKSRIGTSTVLKNVLHSDMETIRMTLENIDTETFDCVVDSIINAKRR